MLNLLKKNSWKSSLPPPQPPSPHPPPPKKKKLTDDFKINHAVSQSKVNSCCIAFILTVQRWKRIYEKPYEKVIFSLIRLWLAKRFHIAKLKMIKHQGPSIPMKMIQKTQRETNVLQFPTFCHICYWMMKLQEVWIL